MPLFREKKETPGGLGAKKGPDVYSSARRIQHASKSWWNSPGMRKARKDFWKKLSRGAKNFVDNELINP